MKGVSLSTHLKIVFYMKRWIPPTSGSFQLTQRWCAPIRRTNVYRDWFRNSGTATFRSLPDQSMTFCSSGHKETEPVKVLQLEYPTISYTNKLHEGNRKTLLTQTLHRKTLKLLHEIEIFFRLRRATNLTSLGKLLRSYFVTIIQTL